MVRVATQNPSTEMTMTDDKVALLELIEKSADADLVREMLGFAAERLMEAEVQVRAGAAHGVRDPARVVQRNGYRERAWETRAGRIELAIPRLRRGSYFPLLPGAPPDGGEGAHGGDPGGVHPRRLHPGRRRPGQGDGRLGHLQERGQ